MKADELKGVASSIRDLSLCYKDFGNVLGGVIDTVKPLKKLVGEPDLEGKGKGSRLITAGMALIAFPDPTISDVVGVSLVVAGTMKNQMKQTTVADMYREFPDLMKELEDVTRRIILR